MCIINKKVFGCQEMKQKNEQKNVDNKQIGERLQKARKLIGFDTQKEIAEKLGLHWRTIQTYEQGAFKKIPLNYIDKLQEHFNVSKKWILTGEGNVYNEQKNNIENKIAEIPKKHPSPDSIPVEVLSVRPSAGSSSHLEAIDVFDSGERIYIDKALFKAPPKGKVRAMQVDGYSMVPMLFPDSWVIVDETKEFVGDGLYVINWNNVLMVKLLEVNLKTNKLWVKSANPDYDSWEVDLENDQRVFEIYGKVLRCII